MKRRTIISEHPQLRCATCRQPVRRAVIIEGKPYCSIHAGELTAGRSGDTSLAAALRDLFELPKNNGQA